jgi:hypothetical protein
MQLTATSYAIEFINSKIFGIANHPDAQMCAIKEIKPFPVKLSKTFPTRKANQYGMGGFSSETQAIHKHFFSLAEGCRSSSTQFRDKTCKQIIGSLKKIINEDAYGHKAFKKTSWLAGFALSSRIAYPMFMALETAILHDITKEEAIKTRDEIIKWFKKRRVKVINFYDSKRDKLWNNHDVSWEVLLAVAGIEDNTEASIQRINTVLDKTFANMRSDGSIPAETRRGAMALHYTALNLSFLLRGMMILQANEKLKEKHIDDFAKAVDYYLLALADFKLIDQYAAENHNSGRDNPRELEFFALHGGIGMVRLFADKFDRSDLKKRLRNLTIDDRMCSYTNTKRKAKEWFVSCPSPKIRLEKNYSFMTPLGLNSCLYNSFISPSQQ